MGLSNELISQFAKITNDKKASRIDEVTLYGEVVTCDDSVCVRFDGSDELTPVTTVTEKDENGNIKNFKYGAASVKTGDRVSVSLKNHSATITGNLSDPPMGRAEVLITEDSITAKIGEDVKVQLDALGVKITGLTTFTNNLSDGLEKGTTTIDGACIKTGTIDAERINLKGTILTNYSIDGQNDWHEEMTDEDMYRRDSLDGGKTWLKAYKFKGQDGKNGVDGSDANVPSYVELAGLNFTSLSNGYIKSPKIYGGQFYGNEFNIISDGSDGSFNIYGDFDGKQYEFLQVKYWDGLPPSVNFWSPDGASLVFGTMDSPSASSIEFWGNIDFSHATVTGLTATFG